MPLSEDEWEDAHNLPMKQVVLRFLLDNPDQGFDTVEISEGINLKLRPETQKDAEHPTRGLISTLYRVHKVKRICSNLVKEGKASKKFVESDRGGKIIYYRYRD